jgi:hypothetical protein
MTECFETRFGGNYIVCVDGYYNQLQDVESCISFILNGIKSDTYSMYDFEVYKQIPLKFKLDLGLGEE